MKKIILTVALAGLIGAGATPAFACEGGKCTMEHADKTKKSKKSKKVAAATENCNMTSATTGSSDTPSCCMKKDKAKADATKETTAISETKSQK